MSRGLIKGIIGLPANLFYGAGIPAWIVVIDKENAHARTGIFMIDASKGFIKDGNKNRLRAQDNHQIVDVFNRQVELPRYSRMVPVSEIASPANDYNLNLPRYIDSSEPEDLHDLDAHLNGGIPNRDIDALDAYWSVFPSLRGALFKENGRPGYSDARVPSMEVKPAILACPEFTTFSAQVKQEAMNYKAYLARVVELSKRVSQPETQSSYPASINNGALRALYDNLEDADDAVMEVREPQPIYGSGPAPDDRAARALALDRAIRAVKKADWRGNRFKEKEVRNAIVSKLGESDAVNKIFEIVKNQREY